MSFNKMAAVCKEVQRRTKEGEKVGEFVARFHVESACTNCHQEILVKIDQKHMAEFFADCTKFPDACVPPSARQYKSGDNTTIMLCPNCTDKVAVCFKCGQYVKIRNGGFPPAGWNQVGKQLYCEKHEVVVQ